MSDRPRTIVLTGATRGLGRALVDGFIRAGHVVAGCGRSETAVAELREAHASPHDFAAVDVADDAAVERWARHVLDEVGVPDLLLNNAALMNRLAPLWEITADEMRAMNAVNIEGVLNVVRAFTPAMIERGSGVIVNMSSGWGQSTSPEVGPYCTTKWAIEGFSRALADDLPDTIASIPLSPGVIDTDMLRQAWSDGAAAHPDPAEWVETAVPFILGLGTEHSGKSLRIPQ